MRGEGISSRVNSFLSTALGGGVRDLLTLHSCALAGSTRSARKCCKEATIICRLSLMAEWFCNLQLVLDMRRHDVICWFSSVLSCEQQ